MPWTKEMEAVSATFRLLGEGTLVQFSEHEGAYVEGLITKIGFDYVNIRRSDAYQEWPFFFRAIALDTISEWKQP